RVLPARAQKISDDSQHVLPRSRVGPADEVEDLAHAAVQSLVTPFESFEDFDPADKTRPLTSRLRQAVLNLLRSFAEQLAFLAAIDERLSGIHDLDSQCFLTLGKLTQLDVERRKMFRRLRRFQAEPLALAAQAVKLSTQARSFILHSRGLAHLFEM